ncbi:MAG UNVERIFIED_CONTAM: DUF433 domain-containing protein [Microcystis novacekii LVE1205-3]|jgi:hypothetical protein
MIDPNISFGKPVITGTGIPTKIVTELYDVGDSIEDIAMIIIVNLGKLKKRFYSSPIGEQA